MLICTTLWLFTKMTDRRTRYSLWSFGVLRWVCEHRGDVLDSWKFLITFNKSNGVLFLCLHSLTYTLRVFRKILKDYTSLRLRSRFVELFLIFPPNLPLVFEWGYGNTEIVLYSLNIDKWVKNSFNCIFVFLGRVAAMSCVRDYVKQKNDPQSS